MSVLINTCTSLSHKPRSGIKLFVVCVSSVFVGCSESHKLFSEQIDHEVARALIDFAGQAIETSVDNSLSLLLTPLHTSREDS